jgi:hypothetical protein
MYKFLIEVGKKILGTNSKSVADSLIKQGGKKIPKSKVPEGAKIEKAPTVPNPRNSAGNFTKPQPPTRPKQTAPAKPTTSRTSPAKPSNSSTSPAKPKMDTKAPARPKPKAKPPAVPTKAPKSTAGNSTKSGKPPLMPKRMVKERPNLPPKPKTSKPALLRDSARESAPEINLKSPDRTSSGPSTRPNNRPSTKTGSSGPSTRPNNKPKTAKKSNTPATSPRPKLRPATASKKTAAADPLKGWSEARRKALRSDKIGKDAGDGMKWVVGANSNALVRTRDESRVKANLSAKRALK